MESMARQGSSGGGGGGGGERAAGLGTLGTLRALARGEGLATLYSGLLPTLLRDAPYSGLYISFFTAIKGALGAGGAEQPAGPPRGAAAWAPLPLKTFAAGLAAGALATALTHPADVLKTRLQLQPPARARGLAAGGVLYDRLRENVGLGDERAAAGAEARGAVPRHPPGAALLALSRR
jgi:solute carrier family 25 protein 38